MQWVDMHGQALLVSGTTRRMHAVALPGGLLLHARHPCKFAARYRGAALSIVVCSKAPPCHDHSACPFAGDVQWPQDQDRGKRTPRPHVQRECGAGLRQRTVGMMCPEQQMPLRMIATCSLATGLSSRSRVSLPLTARRHEAHRLCFQRPLLAPVRLPCSTRLPCPQVLWRLGQDFMAKNSGGS